jgi:uncharacterized protein (DUF1800 family)
MDRRDFFSNIANQKEKLKDLQKPGTPLKHNLSGFDVKEGLEPYKGEWTEKEAAHLLRRTMFGFYRSKLSEAVTLGLAGSIDKLLSKPAAPATPPLNVNPVDTAVPIGQTWIDAPYNGLLESQRIASYKTWWAIQMLSESFSITEKMTFFWHNHFATETDTTMVGALNYRYNTLLRENAVGNFKDLVGKITIDANMLLYLNGATNTAGAPNENYARELFELFTVGKGKQIAPGNYTNYTEDDIKSAAKVLTGWTINRVSGAVAFNSNRHDKTSKQFSSIFNNLIISNAGDKEYLQLIDMIFTNEAASKYICRKLYRYFVFYNIDEKIEAQIIEPLAKILRDNNYDIKPVLKTLLSSAHFFSEELRGTMLKNPLDFVCNFVKQFDVKFPSETPNQNNIVVDTYQAVSVIVIYFCILLDLYLADPPSVAGYPAYYQIPSYYHLWLSSVTIANRMKFTDILIFAGFNSGSVSIKVNVIRFATSIPNYNNIDLFIENATNVLVPKPLTKIQKDFLKLVMLQGVPDYTWTEQWDLYQKNKNDKTIVEGLTNKLIYFLAVVCSMSEYQLI